MFNFFELNIQIDSFYKCIIAKYTVLVYSGLLVSVKKVRVASSFIEQKERL